MNAVALRSYLFGVGSTGILFGILLLIDPNTTPNFIATLICGILNIGYGTYMIGPLAEAYLKFEEIKEENPEVQFTPELEDMLADAIVEECRASFIFLTVLSVIMLIVGTQYPAAYLVSIAASCSYLFMTEFLYQYWIDAYKKKENE